MELRKAFIAGQMYHVYNRGNGNESIFRCDDNYEYFLKKYHMYMDPWWQTHAWCLLPGEFHFIVSVRETPFGTTELTKKISRSFADFSGGYVQAFNKYHIRKGSLLRRAFKRTFVHSAEPIRNLVCSMHNRAKVDGLVVDAESWEFSSYAKLLNCTPEDFLCHPILRLYGSKEEFVRQHKMQLSTGPIELSYISAA